MNQISIVLFFTSLVIPFKATLDIDTIDGDYYGSWADTKWEYHFKTEKTYTFKSEGHFGLTNSYGTYKINHDTLTLNSYSGDSINPIDKPNFLKFKDKKFLIDSDSCIIEIANRYDYCKTKFKQDSDGSTTIYGSQKR
ncbi:MAG: hypothetical protein K9H61_13485 [Bacteroidia bacterium]|nr:hypothetical protein [Bacteroidia bacterium]MCF8425191.1 hypothetical protein [Bacteroidia bacterium]MCF8447996.1 hypothetical protein [Bacteroidia bacterium]